MNRTYLRMATRKRTINRMFLAWDILKVGAFVCLFALAIGLIERIG